MCSAPQEYQLGSEGLEGFLLFQELLKQKSKFGKSCDKQ